MLSVLCLVFGAIAPSHQAPQVCAESSACTDRDPGKISWFQGSWSELLAEAAKTKRVVFVDFWTEWCVYCKKLGGVTLSADSVVAEMKDFLCYSVDAESEEGRRLTKQFNVRGYPALFFFEPDGSLRDRLSGYYAPDAFLSEIRRIRKNEDTISGLRAKIQSDPSGALEARWALAKKLKAIGDVKGYEEQLAVLSELDPSGKTPAVRRLKLDELRSRAEDKLELEPLYTFLESETDSTLLFEGWLTAWKLEEQLARRKGDPEEACEHRKRWFAAAHALWPHVPPEYYGHLGNNIAWSFYENRDWLTKADMVFALSIAEKAVAAAPESAAVIDTHACCLFVLGRREEALAAIERCIAIDPKNPAWRERLAEFRSAR